MGESLELLAIAAHIETLLAKQAMIIEAMQKTLEKAMGEVEKVREEGRRKLRVDEI